MEFLGDSSALLQEHILPSDALLLLFTRFDFGRSRVPPSDSALFYQGVVTKQEPPIDAIFPAQPCLKLKRVAPRKCKLPRRLHLLGIVGMNYRANYVY